MHEEQEAQLHLAPSPRYYWSTTFSVYSVTACNIKKSFIF